ncbi:hypothetical protein [Neptuniibacter sp.]|uniref:hypothetical protein n=1 Tax=Neptuniibacter sp. TaxID=1962643 RepID=UPI002631CB76|nr:hypothetical protein [Neptuniibacter sp.]MCP4596586.1 hypothetical protein [Neptuniibacter sp.]
MTILNIISKQLKYSAVHLMLSLLPILTLVFTLIRSDRLKDAVSALKNEYFILGVPSNPWQEFLPLFSSTILAFIGFSWLVGFIARNSQSSWWKLPASILLIILAAVAFGLSMVFASLFHLWFQHAPIIGSLGSSSLFWVSFGLSLVVLIIGVWTTATERTEVGSLKSSKSE